jgi:hypothetical protein
MVKMTYGMVIGTLAPSQIMVEVSTLSCVILDASAVLSQGDTVVRTLDLLLTCGE